MLEAPHSLGQRPIGPGELDNLGQILENAGAGIDVVAVSRQDLLQDDSRPAADVDELDAPGGRLVWRVAEPTKVKVADCRDDTIEARHGHLKVEQSLGVLLHDGPDRGPVLLVVRGVGVADRVIGLDSVLELAVLGEILVKVVHGLAPLVVPVRLAVSACPGPESGSTHRAKKR